MEQIYFEADEEITSCIDKIRKTDEQEVVLIFPKKAAIIHSLVSLKLLKKQAAMFGKRLIVVILEEIGRNLAKSAGLSLGKITNSGEVILLKEESEEAEAKSKKSVFKNEEEKEQEPQEKFSEICRETAKKVSLLPKIKFKKILPAVVIFAAFFIYLCFFILPKAEIKIVPKTKSYASEEEIVIDSQVSNITQDKNIIPGKLETKEVWIGKKKFEVKGEKEIGDKTKGEIIVYNKFSSESITLPKETEFKTDGKIFLSLSDFEIPGAKVKGGKTISGQVNVKVEAKEGGDKYNIKPSLFILSSLPAHQQNDIWGESRAEFSGGTSKKIKAISEEDLKQAREELIKEGARQIQEQIKNSIAQNQMFIEGVIFSEIMEAKTERKVGDEAVSFEMEGRIRAKIIIFSKEDLKNVVFREFNKKLEGKKMIVDNNLEDGVLYEVKNFDANLGKLVFKVKVNKLAASAFDFEKMKIELFGLNKRQIQEKLMAGSKIREVEVNFWPFWVKKAPADKAKIEIILDIKK